VQITTNDQAVFVTGPDSFTDELVAMLSGGMSNSINHYLAATIDLYIFYVSAPSMLLHQGLPLLLYNTNLSPDEVKTLLFTQSSYVCQL
jgi:hypothetical protein